MFEPAKCDLNFRTCKSRLETFVLFISFIWIAIADNLNIQKTMAITFTLLLAFPSIVNLFRAKRNSTHQKKKKKPTNMYKYISYYCGSFDLVVQIEISRIRSFRFKILHPFPLFLNSIFSLLEFIHTHTNYFFSKKNPTDNDYIVGKKNRRGKRYQK